MPANNLTLFGKDNVKYCAQDCSLMSLMVVSRRKYCPVTQVLEDASIRSREAHQN